MLTRAAEPTTGQVAGALPTGFGRLMGGGFGLVVVLVVPVFLVVVVDWPELPPLDPPPLPPPPADPAVVVVEAPTSKVRKSVKRISVLGLDRLRYTVRAPCQPIGGPPCG
jgi:hypothetical protein